MYLAKKCHRIVLIILSISLLFSVLSENKQEDTSRLCYIFPQFICTAASSHSDRPENDDISYSFGIVEIINKLRK